MFKTRFISMLVLLAAVVTGAWAQDYTITLPSVSNGSVVAKVSDVSVTSAAAGATVTLVATPDAGYKLKTISGTYQEPPKETLSGSNHPATLSGTYFTLSSSARTNARWNLYNSTITITSNDAGIKIDRVVFNLNYKGNQFDPSLLSADNGTLSVSGNTLTVTSINSSSVTITSTANAAKGCGTDQVTIYDTGSVALTLTDTGDDNVKTFTMPSGNVTISAEYTKNEVTLTDGDDLSALSAYVGEQCDVTYLRSFTAGKPSTVCLPFAYTPKSGETFYTFTGINEDGGNYTADMTEVVSPLVANTPYLFMPTGDADFSGTYAIPDPLTAGTTTTTSGDWTFKGTYSTIEWTDAPEDPTYGFSAQAANDGITQGQFVKVGAYVRIKPMRAYLEYNGSDSQFKNARSLTRAAATTSDDTLPETIGVRLISANGEVTAIGTLHTQTGEVVLDGWYTLDGTRLSGQPTRKGIYVNNGKKVIIK